MATRLEQILARTRDFDKPADVKPVRRPMQEMPVYDIHAVMPFVMDALDTPDNYDIWLGETLLTDLTPMQTQMVLRKVKSQLMREVNEVQKELDRIDLLEMAVDDPRYTMDILYPQYYELQPRMEIKR